MTVFDSILSFFGFDDDEKKGDEPSLIQKNNDVVPKVHNIQQVEQAPFEIRVSVPKTYDDSVNIATHLQKGRAILLNLQYLDPSTSKRLIDFLCGTVYALGGNMKKISDVLFVFSSKNVLIESADDISEFEKASHEYLSYKLDAMSGS